ncbi:polysaccharide deacetylase family protein [Paenibacillus donghaensis]|uniref:NodB homology domain-containing protein n=1 Tax=Paenibacillus donghaensis TaxID=414771 RepID=A0A2Z2KF17_9BACL|nr:polysaccharide deacetylase family protein [Paenibacillus donghaensis]ASA24704.1 hypothetical protein B9T62_30485 [Paenibacillus donghaensis]
MSVHPANAARMIELLSLEQRQDVYRMEVGLTHSSGFARKMLIIDEYTYMQLNQLGPFEGRRVRLSPYPKWDPFRRTFFSSLIKMNKTFSETLYFACSSDYASQLVGFWPEEELPSDSEPTSLTPEVPPPAPSPLNRRRSLRPARLVLLIGILFGCLIALFLLRMDGKLFRNSAEAYEDSVQAAEVSEFSVPAPYVPVIQAAEYQSSQMQAVPEDVQLRQQHPAEAQKEEDKLYEEIELEGDSYQYSLPQGYVALSFDDGPSKYTRQIVDILQEHGVAANFLFIGQNARRYPAEVRYADEHGMPVGNHSWDHSDMTRNSSQENRENLERATRELEQNMLSAVTVFRPPYGAVNDELAAEVGRQQMKLLLWNRDPEDWKAGNAEQVLRYFQMTDPSGGMYLLHEKAVTVKALPDIITHLKAKGLKFAIFK